MAEFKADMHDITVKDESPIAGSHLELLLDITSTYQVGRSILAMVGSAPGTGKSEARCILQGPFQSAFVDRRTCGQRRGTRSSL